MEPQAILVWLVILWRLNLLYLRIKIYVCLLISAMSRPLLNVLELFVFQAGNRV